VAAADLDHATRAHQLGDDRLEQVARAHAQLRGDLLEAEADRRRGESLEDLVGAGERAAIARP
jgi:hypothetical protein